MKYLFNYAILFFLAGMLTNAVVWRLAQHRYDDISYPIVILVCVIGAIVLRLQNDNNHKL